VNFGLPARGRDRRLKTEAAHDLLHFGIDPMRCGHRGDHHDTAGALDVAAVEPPQRQAGPRKLLQQKRAHMRLVGAAAGDRYNISDFDLASHQWLPVDEDDNGAQQQVDEEDKAGGDRRVGR
jgi:hypothetical protein